MKDDKNSNIETARHKEVGSRNMLFLYLEKKLKIIC